MGSQAIPPLRQALIWNSTIHESWELAIGGTVFIRGAVVGPSLGGGGVLAFSGGFVGGRSGCAYDQMIHPKRRIESILGGGLLFLLLEIRH